MFGVYAVQECMKDLNEEGFEFNSHKEVIDEYKKRLEDAGYDIVRILFDINEDTIYAQSRIH